MTDDRPARLITKTVTIDRPWPHISGDTATGLEASAAMQQNQPFCTNSAAAHTPLTGGAQLAIGASMR